MRDWLLFITLSPSFHCCYVAYAIADLGLVVTIYDIVDIGEGSVFHSEGNAHYKVTFNVIVFRPFAGETLQGKIVDMDS